MLTVLVTAALAFALFLLPAAFLVAAILAAGAIVGTIVLALLPSLSSVAAFVLIGWAACKGVSRRRLRPSDGGLR